MPKTDVPPIAIDGDCARTPRRPAADPTQSRQMPERRDEAASEAPGGGPEDRPVDREEMEPPAVAGRP